MAKSDHAGHPASLKMAGMGEQESTIDWRCIMPQLKSIQGTSADDAHQPQHNFRGVREHVVDFEFRFLNSFSDDLLDRWHDHNLLSMNNLRFDAGDAQGS